MAERPPFRIGYLSVLLPADTPETQVRSMLRQKVIEAFDAAIARGDGSIAFGGQLIDLPIVERAKRTVAFAAKLGVAAASS